MFCRREQREVEGIAVRNSRRVNRRSSVFKDSLEHEVSMIYLISFLLNSLSFGMKCCDRAARLVGNVSFFLVFLVAPASLSAGPSFSAAPQEGKWRQGSSCSVLYMKSSASISNF